MIALPFLISTLMFTSSATTFVHHHNGAWCTSNGKIALTQKENYEIVHLPRISEAACRSRCEADAQCDFAQTFNHLAYAAGWPPHCRLHRNAYCDSEKLITTDIWFQVWLKASAIPPVTTANPTKDPTRNPTMIPTASPSQNPTINPTRMPTASPSSNPTMIPTASPSQTPTTNPTANPSPFPTAADFIIKIKAFHGKPSDIKVQAQPDVDVYLGNFEQKLTPVNGDRRLLSSDQQ